jgi:hypothetical protein
VSRKGTRQAFNGIDGPTVAAKFVCLPGPAGHTPYLNVSLIRRPYRDHAIAERIAPPTPLRRQLGRGHDFSLDHVRAGPARTTRWSNFSEVSPVPASIFCDRSMAARYDVNSAANTSARPRPRYHSTHPRRRPSCDVSSAATTLSQHGPPVGAPYDVSSVAASTRIQQHCAYDPREQLLGRQLGPSSDFVRLQSGRTLRRQICRQQRCPRCTSLTPC